jgi:hypothetical protein
MKKILVVAFIALPIASSQSMEQAWGAITNVVLGNTKRDYTQQITTIDNDTSLNQITKLRKKSAIYIKLRNENRGKEEYHTYNAQADELRAQAQQLEKKERAIREEELRKQKIFDEEADILNLIKAVKKDNDRSILDKVTDTIGFYEQLANLFENEDETQYNIYSNRLAEFINKKEYLHAHQLAQTTNDKYEKIALLQKLARLSNNEERAKQHRDAAQALQEELQTQERDKIHQELVLLLAQSKDKSQQAKLCRSIAQVCGQLQVQTYLAHAEQLEKEAEADQKLQQMIVSKTCHIVGLNAEIAKTEVDTNLSRFARLDKLAGLIEKRAQLSKDIPNFAQNYNADVARARKLRTESITLAPTEATRQAIIRLLQ